MAGEFDFDAPLHSIQDNSTFHGTAGQEHDEWFGISHGHLLRPAMSKAPRRVNRAAAAPSSSARSAGGQSTKRARGSAKSSATHRTSSGSSSGKPRERCGTGRARAEQRRRSKPVDAASGDDLAAKLAAHNKKFSRTAYEPRAHSLRDVKRWEAATGKVYAKLGYAERAEANAAIAARKAASAATAAR